MNIVRSHSVCFLALLLATFSLALLRTTLADAQPYGLDAPTPVGAFLNGVMPSRTPQSPGSSNWTVVDAFPDLVLPNTLVIEPNPSNNRLYVGSRSGVIVSFDNTEQVATSEPFMDLSDRVAVVWDGGFLGLTFHRDFGIQGSPNETTFYAYYSSYCPTALNNQSYVIDFSNCNPGYPTSSTSGFFNTWLRLSRFQAYWDATAGVWRGDPASEVPLFNIRLYNGSHRGGGPVFGNDGYLYVAIGDQFHYDTAQTIVDNFEGGSMRLAVDVTDNGDGTWTCAAGSHMPVRRMQDVTGNPDEMTGYSYCIPDDNPWPGLAGENFGEYNSIGHRNPHRIALDPVTGLLWSGEVGQSTREEINVIIKGRNYQWPYMEGLAMGVRSKPSTIIGIEQPPVIDFDRTEARTIIGGYVYRGTRFPELSGRYIAGDYTTDNIWAITLDINTMTATRDLLTIFPSGSLGTFGQDNNGEIFMGDVAANIPLQRLERIGNPVPDPPALLSQTGALTDTENFVVNPAGVPYDLVPFWSDGAHKQRWLFLPNDGTHDTAAEQIIFSEQGNWGFPTGTVAMKHFELPVDETNPDVRVRLETRLQVLGDDGKVYGVTYRWQPDQRDAYLLTTAETGVYTIQQAGGGTRDQTWLFPSRNDCLQCHTDGAGEFLGLRTHHQNRDLTYPSTERTDNQLRTWNALGMFTPPLSEPDIPTFPQAAQLDDPTASLELRARSWLDSNCSNCHRPETGNRAAFDARFTTPLAGQGLIWGSVIDGLGITDPYIVHPGDPSSSVLYHRALAAGGSPIAMPPLAKELAQDEAIDLLRAWILRVDPGYPRGGVDYEYYEETGLSILPDFDALTPVTTGSAPTFDISLRERDDDFAFRFTGFIKIPQGGTWTFYTSSDDGSRLYIGGSLVVDNDGLHANQERSGIISLSPGFYPITVTMFERGGQQVLLASWEGPGVAKQPISPAALFSEVPAPITNTPPVLNNPGTQSGTEGEVVSLFLVATDGDGDLLYFEAGGLPGGLSVDANTGEINGTISAGQAGNWSVTASTSDGPEIDVVLFDWIVSAPDTDGDGLNDSVDPYPNDVDGDDDGLVDGAGGIVCVASGPGCTAVYPAGVDNDGDGYVDGEHDYATDPTLSDSDTDGYDDGMEVRYGSDPQSTGDTPENNHVNNGDVDGNGVVDVRDVLRALRIVLDLYTPDNNELIRADMVPDGVVNTGDLLRIQQSAIAM